MLAKVMQYFRFDQSNCAGFAVLHIRQHTIDLLLLPDDSIEPTAIVQPIAQGNWQHALEQALSKVSKTMTLTVIIPPDMYQIIQLEKPALSEQELVAALPWQVKDLTDIVVEELILDYIDLPAAPGQPLKINVVVAAKTQLLELIAIISQQKLILKKILVEEWLIHELLEYADHAALVLMHQPDQDVLLQVIRQGQLQFSRRLRGFNRLHQYDTSELEQGVFDNLLLEIQRSMDYIESQLKLPPVRSIYLLCSGHERTDLVPLFHRAGFKQVQTLQLKSALNWAATLDTNECWPTIAAVASANEVAAT
jgi:MSHA biogenesis protein MshI